MGGQVNDRIKQVGGIEIFKEIHEYNSLYSTGIVVTNAGKLQAKKIFHGLLRRPYKSIVKGLVNISIRTAYELGLQTIAFPLFGSGVRIFSTREAWQIILPQIIKNLSNKNQTVREVIICIYSRQEVEQINVRETLQDIQIFGWESLL